jgi:hypothetical protein
MLKLAACLPCLMTLSLGCSTVIVDRGGQLPKHIAAGEKALAENVDDSRPPAKGPASREFLNAGPRAGYSYYFGETADQLKTAKRSRALSMVGWQLEYRYMTTEDGHEGLIEFLPLVIGLEESMFPNVSLNLLVGLRTRTGWELGIGPSLAIYNEDDFIPENAPIDGDIAASLGLVVAGGFTFTADEMRFPVNLSLRRSEDTTNVALTVGWNVRQ